MNWVRLVNVLCFVVCVVSAIVGTALGVFAIWTTCDTEILWKAFSTVAVLFTGSAAVGLVTHWLPKEPKQ